MGKGKNSPFLKLQSEKKREVDSLKGKEPRQNEGGPVKGKKKASASSL